MSMRYQIMRIVVVARYHLTIGLALAACLLIATPVWATSITFASAQSYTVGRDPISVTGADFNGDGKADLAAALLNSGTSSTTGFLDDVSVLLNRGDGTFGTAQQY